MAGTSRFFPLFIDLTGKKIVVVGGGNIAERRIHSLLSFGADITLISPRVTDSIFSSINSKQIRFIEREYISGDIRIENPFLVIAATDNQSVNHAIMKEAKSLDVLVIVSDDRNECNAYFPAVCENEEYISGIVSKTGNHSGVKEKAKKLRAWLNHE